ncbi:MAG TPA: hypothetical protein VF454_07220, partial [Gemmatimonadales bacterium]
VAGDPLATALQVELRDARGNRVMNSSLAVTVAPAGAATGTPLHGTTTQLADQGRATFTNLWFERAGADRFKVTVGAFPVDSATLVAIAPGSPAMVHSSLVNDTLRAGDPTGLTVTFQDRFGNAITSYNGPVQAISLHGLGLVGLSGDSVVDAVRGVATFPDMYFTVAGAPYRLTATLPGIAIQRDTTPNTWVRHATAYRAFAGSQGGIQAPRGHFGDSTYFELQDRFGNPILDTTLQIQVGVTDWAYSSPAPYGQAVDGPGIVNYVDTHGAIALGVRRPGVVRMIYSIAGGVSDTSAPYGVSLPQTSGSTLALTDRTTCVWSIFCSGDNSYGQLGVDQVKEPMDSLFVLNDSGGFPGFFADGGARHLCVGIFDTLANASRVGCQGDNSDGQLGGGSVGGTSATFVQGALITDLTALTAGGAHTCAIEDGVLKCWGRNAEGQLGSGSAGAATGTPVTVVGGHIFSKISAGGHHTCGIDDSFQMWCWGANDKGQLGDSGVSGAFSATPVLVGGAHGWLLVSAGEDFTCGYDAAVTTGVQCWGNNDHHQIGPWTDSIRVLPSLALGATSVQKLTAGKDFACATAQTVSNPQTFCWGANDKGQLGRGTLTPFEGTPLPIDGTLIPELQEMNVLVAAADHVCGAAPGLPTRLICWGVNSHGEFGAGNTTDSPFPIVVERQYQQF